MSVAMNYILTKYKFLILVILYTIANYLKKQLFFKAAYHYMQMLQLHPPQKKITFAKQQQSTTDISEKEELPKKINFTEQISPSNIAVKEGEVQVQKLTIDISNGIITSEKDAKFKLEAPKTLIEIVQRQQRRISSSSFLRSSDENSNYRC